MKREAELNAILESSPEAITVTDLDGNIFECNQAAVDIHGLESKEDLDVAREFSLVGLILAKKKITHKRAISEY